MENIRYASVSTKSGVIQLNEKMIPIEINNKSNHEVLNSLQGTSCHSDIIVPINSCLKEFESVQSFCPDGKNFSYICWYVNNIVFAYATGIQKVSLKLDLTNEIKGFNKEAYSNINKLKGWYSVPYNYIYLCSAVNLAYKSAKSFNNA